MNFYIVSLLHFFIMLWLIFLFKIIFNKFNFNASNKFLLVDSIILSFNFLIFNLILNLYINISFDSNYWWYEFLLYLIFIFIIPYIYTIFKRKKILKFNKDISIFYYWYELLIIFISLLGSVAIYENFLK